MLLYQPDPGGDPDPEPRLPAELLCYLSEPLGDPSVTIVYLDRLTHILELP